MMCVVCGDSYPRSGRRRYCTDACRQLAWRQRHTTTPPALPARVPRVDTVYECPTCETRYLGEQRCDDCNVFCRRIGPGAPCPHCDEPIALSDLLPDTANRPQP